MKPIRITITDWGPFKGSQTFEFPQAPGLYFLWGRNEAQPRLGGNGAGKTRLFEALVWVFYGKTSRGLKAGEVANWEVGKNAAVAFTYEVDELPATIERRWSPNSWTLTTYDGSVIDLAKDEGNGALADLALSFESFLNVVLMAQTRPMFLDLKSDAKAALFSEVMGLDRWLDASKKAGQKASAEDEKCRDIEKQLARLEGQLEQLQSQTQDVEALAEEWEAKRQKHLRSVEALYEGALERRKGAKAALIEAEDREALARHNLRLASESAGSEDGLEKARDWAADSRDSVTRLKVQLDALKAHEKLLKDHDKCPTCGQDLEINHWAHESGKAAKVKDQLAGSLRLAEDAARIAAEDVAKLERRMREAADLIKAETRAVDRAEQFTRDARTALAKIDRELDLLEDDAETLEGKENPHHAGKQDSAEKEAALRIDLRHLRRLLDDGLGRYRVFTQWVRWFKELRLELIGEALAQLEVEVNSEVSALGLVGWSLNFQVDRETASGALQRGFIVTVTSPDNQRPVPWEAWSGGEAQRLRVAAQCGLANLIRAHTGATIDLEAWDEPTGGMSPQGIADLLRALEQRAITEQRQVWIIDHHSLSFGGFAGSAGVIKTKSGSQFDQDGLYISGKERDDARESQAPRTRRRSLHDGLGSSPRARHPLIT